LTKQVNRPRAPQ